MQSRCFVFNDWIIHDLCGDNGLNNQAAGVRLLSLIREKCDRLAVVRGNQWSVKAHGLMRHSDPILRKISKKLLSLIYDPNKCHILEAFEVPELDDNIRVAIHVKDHYLVECYFAAKADLLITSDHPLRQAIEGLDNHPINVAMRDDFLKEYLHD